MARRTITDADIKATFDTVDTNLISDFYMHLQLNKHHGLKTEAKKKATQVRQIFFQLAVCHVHPAIGIIHFIFLSLIIKIPGE
jgi:hypothetical protein